uniref:SH2 domain-containing protein n=1 Tax=Hymenolepis diminuta TaxID=6216 RepID=A0A0R3SRX9_HYMDI
LGTSASSTMSSSTTNGSTKNSTGSSRPGNLTDEDRRLLAQLWSQMEPSGDSPPPPPKPPLSLESPRWSAGESLADLPPSPFSDCSEPGYTNVRADAKLNAYLRSLAEAIQLTPPTNGQMEESIYSNIDSPGPVSQSTKGFPSPPPPQLPTRNVSKPSNGCLDLESLNLPHADDSDASEKENEERLAENEAKDQVRTLRPTSYVCYLNSKSAPPPPPPPKESLMQTHSTASRPGNYRGPLGNSVSIDHADEYEMEDKSNNGCLDSGAWEPLDSATLPDQLVASLATLNIDPLSDTSMQGEVLNAVQRMQNGVYKEASPQHKVSFANSPPCFCNENSGENGDQAPCCHAETKLDTEDDFEMIFANGKKYKRYFKRHIVFQRHLCRQVSVHQFVTLVVVAPSLPDGTGPDLSRQVAHGPVQICRLDNGTSLSPSKSSSQIPPLTNGGDVPSCSTSTLPRGDDSSSCSSSSFSNGKPPIVPTSPNTSMSSTNNTLTSYMYKFGRSDPQDPSLESRISRNVSDFFHAKWCKRESAHGPHERSKTVAYVQKYSQPTATGPPIQHNTCAQQTCRVRMVDGIEELKQQTPSIPIVYTPSPENSMESCSPIATSSLPSTSSTLPRSSRGRSLSRGPLVVIDRRSPRVRPISNLLLPHGDSVNGKGPLKIEVPSGSQPLLTDLSESVGLGYRENGCRHSQRKVSLECSSLETDVEGDVSSISLINVELPSVENAEKNHPLLMEQDATPYLEFDYSDSENELQVQAGTVDALIVYATSLGLLLTLDVFLVMYRTFVTSEELISLLIQRYLLFQSSIKLIATVDEKTREKICNVVISYLIRVISQLSTDLNSQIYSVLNLFRERVMDDGYGGLARALDFTLSNQLKQRQRRRASTQSQETAPNPSTTTSPLVSPRPSEENYSSSPVTSSVSVSVRRSHSIGAVAGFAVGAHQLKNGSHKLSTGIPNFSSSSARNSFSMVPGSESSLNLSPSASTAALSDIDFESSTGTQSLVSGRPSTASCFSSPASARRLLGPSVPVSMVTLRRHSRTSASGGQRGTSLLEIPAKALAEQITYLEAEKYSRLTLEELLDIKSLSALKAPVMAACAAQFTALSNWAATLLLAPPASQRERHAVKLLKVMNHLHILKNFNSFLAILCSFLLVPENIFSKKTRARLARLRPYMQPPHFANYRRELAEASPPLIPYLGLTLQNLIALEQINPLYLPEVPKGMKASYKPEHGPVVNFWRSWKHFLIINFFVKQDSVEGRAAHYDIKPDLDILDFIADFKTAYPDFALRELINRRKREVS